MNLVAPVHDPADLRELLSSTDGTSIDPLRVAQGPLAADLSRYIREVLGTECAGRGPSSRD
jgi:hypothetical protein